MIMKNIAATKPTFSSEDIDFITGAGSWVEKSMYGKKYMGIERTTIIVCETGKIIKIWRKVRVPGHVDEALNWLTENLA